MKGGEIMALPNLSSPTEYEPLLYDDTIKADIVEPDQDARVLCRIDTFSAVWNNVSIKQCLSFYCCFDAFSDVLKNHNQIQFADLSREIIYQICGIRMTLQYADYIHYSQEEKFLSDFEYFVSVPWTSIRIYLSGTGITWLRQNTEFDVEIMLRQKPDNFQLFHITRVDFAFDFINYHGEFLDKAHAWLLDNRHLTPSGRIPVANTKQGIQFKQIYCPSEHTLYIGCSGASRMLRIYDKRLEIMQKNRGIFVCQDYGDPESVKSVIRVEWQLRNENAAEILFGEALTMKDYWYGILSEIVHMYEFYDFSSVKHLVPKFFRDFFNLDELRLLQKSKLRFIQEIDFNAVNHHWFMRNRRSMLIYMMIHGQKQFIDDIRDYYEMLFTKNFSDPVAASEQALARKAFIARLSECVNGQPLQEALPHLFDEHGNFHFDF